MKRSLSILFFCCLAMVVTSCAPPTNQMSEESRKALQPVASIVVMPARIENDQKAGNAGKKEESRLKAGAAWADTVLKRELAANKKVTILTPSQFNDLEAVVSSQFSATIASVGKQTHSQAVLVLTMHRFKQREGGEYAVDEPASASFDMQLFDTATTNVLWSSQFNETQQSLLSNILSFGKAQSRGFKWITVQDLVAQGIKERLAKCPYL